MASAYFFLIHAVSVFHKFLLRIPYVGEFWDLLSLSLVAVSRLLSGQWIASNLQECNKPKRPLILYEFEGCPYCRRVREALSTLDLDCIVYPCPRETLKSRGFISKSRYRPVVKQIGGKVQFPLLIDENQTVDNNNNPLILYESDVIVDYLWKTYGAKAVPPRSYYYAKKYERFTFVMGSIFRSLPEHGVLRVPSRKPERTLELWSFEPSPFCKRVREVLSSLEIPYHLRNAARGSSKRQEFKERFGRKLSSIRKSLDLIQVPLLVDPNTGVEMLESKNIVKYLLDTYKVGDAPQESWLDYGVDDKKNN